MGRPAAHRALLRAYPRWFREKFGSELSAFLAHQRAEPKYRGFALGPARFWWDAGSDALMTGAKLRLERAQESLSGFLGGRGPGSGGLVEMFATDARHAVRGLMRSPGYAVVFIITLGLGIGANTAMFSAVNSLLLRPLPHEDGDRLVYLRQSTRLPGMENLTFSVPEVNDYRSSLRSLQSVAEFSALNFTLLGYETPRRVRAGIVSGNYFEVMGLSASIGRAMGREDDGAAAAAVVVLTDPYWRGVFGADPEVIGKSVEINGRSATIIGVAEPAPPYPEQTDIYVNLATSPHHLDASMTHDRTHRMTEVFGRLSPAGTVESLRAEAEATAARIHAEHPEAYDAASGFAVSVTPFKTQLTTRARPTFLLLLATALLVLVIACANLANLALTRVIRRGHELAIRASLGASRAALRRELLAESLVLALAGAGLGLVIAFMSRDLLVAFAERFTSRASEISIDPAVFGFALLIALAASLFFTILPALPDAGSAGGTLMRSGARTTAGAGARRMQRTLVVAQIATSFVLLIGAGLLLRTMIHITRTDPGFDTTQVLTMDIPANSLLPRDDATRNRYMSMLEGVRALPGVESAALTGSVPLTGGDGNVSPEIAVDGHAPMAGAPAPRAAMKIVSPAYFTTMGIEILRGRAFMSTDLEDAQTVVIINESMARDYFGERDPVGQRMAWRNELLARFGGIGPEWRTIVGVAEDTRDDGLDAEVPHAVYNAYPQIRLTGSLVVRVRGDAAVIVPRIRDVILAHDPNQPIENIATVEELVSRSVAPRRLNTVLLGAFAALALVIAAVGIGGVLAFSVGARTREFGMRAALGATPRRIRSSVVAEGAALAAAGVVLGGIAAAAGTRFIAGLLVGVPAHDPVTFTAVGLLLIAVAVGASWVPAWRAAAVSPTVALAAE